MIPDENIPHAFDVAGLKEGDSFLGCSNCWFRLDPQTAAKPECPECGTPMRIYNVTAQDIAKHL